MTTTSSSPDSNATLEALRALITSPDGGSLQLVDTGAVVSNQWLATIKDAAAILGQLEAKQVVKGKYVRGSRY